MSAFQFTCKYEEKWYVCKKYYNLDTEWYRGQLVINYDQLFVYEKSVTGGHTNFDKPIVQSEYPLHSLPYSWLMKHIMIYLTVRVK